MSFQRSLLSSHRMSARMSAFAQRAAAGIALAAVATASAQAQVAPERRNVVAYTVSATQEVTQDLLTVTLQANKEGNQAAEVQAALKQQLEAALVEARKAVVPGALEVRTGSFSLYPRYSNQGKTNGWQGQAQLIIEGTDMARITQTVGKLNQLNVVQVNYGLSRALREKHESSVTAEAIAAYRARGLELAKAFGFSNYALGEVSVNSNEGSDNRPMPMMKAARFSAEAADAALPVEPGKGNITVTVSGQVILTP